MKFQVEGLPIANPRATPTGRSSRSRGNKMFVPKDHAILPYKMIIRMTASREVCEKLEGPVKLSLAFQFARPKSHRTAKGNLTKKAPEHHIFTPDCDNLAKGVMDAMNGIAYADDRQVVSLTVSKTWGDSNMTTVELEPYEN